MTANNLTEYWGNSYGYDAWGNLLSETVTKCSSENLSVEALANNQISGYGYDAAGNITSDPTDQVGATYDAENRIAAASNNGVTTTYTYDDSGNRVKKTNGSTGTIYWYSALGVVAESDLLGNMEHEYVFFGGQRVARKDLPGKAVSYYFSDHLQRASVITDSAGNIKAESDYYPFGGELQIVNNDSNDYKFTGKKRDTETGLDYFGARYYSNAFGRFLSPDWSAAPATVPYAHLSNPQTLNLYSYVDNNPINGIDPDGHAREYMVYDAGGWGPNMFIGGPVIETDTSGTVTVSIDAETNIATILSVQVTSVTEGLADSLSGTTGESQSPGQAQGATQDTAQNQVQNAGQGQSAAQQRNGDIQAARQYLSGSAEMSTVMTAFDTGHFHITIIHDGNDRYDPNTRTVYWDPHSALRTTTGGHQTPALGLGHEMAHATSNLHQSAVLQNTPDQRYDNKEERRVIRNYENPAARELGESPRYNHAGTPYNVNCPTCQ